MTSEKSKGPLLNKKLQIVKRIFISKNMQFTTNWFLYHKENNIYQVTAALEQF